jgi:hypothetical protein
MKPMSPSDSPKLKEIGTPEVEMSHASRRVHRRHLPFGAYSVQTPYSVRWTGYSVQYYYWRVWKMGEK